MTERYWAIIPAAGAGRRMGADIPKQYLPLGGRTVIEQTIGRLLEHPAISKVVVALSAKDAWWSGTCYASHPRVLRATGGEERCHSVLNALAVLAEEAGAEDWVLVHDAARPCLRPEDLTRLIELLSSHPVGGLLGMPVRDTMKRTDIDNRVTQTVPRERLWHAYTPQMFRLGLLKKALSQALAKGELVTDDASAMELAGHVPLMVEGHADNIKITRPEDLELAGFYLGAVRK
ncbi:MAG: 2-C-methyl-D-erythritol 4-phosphate cytidylyltransferase [Gammaproteobacteria bacterium]|nr:2-C-methyl-D-erythritol 4-phosphate cytidylyltransferase [Gammaproteobacteria bacterium]MBU1656156.1 2-C-methyl-D-erythritol 4-phosphate cytidylyltransferase [Gammaproteobacteria bacterium]MBU1960805.1 2-C-methyl-D-erythritol 4-phosphate cytidylyltransferase [Gammaproteobacteria bacterium]